MADWTTLPNTAVGVGGLPSGTTVTALRDNPIAIAQGAPGAPRNHPAALDIYKGGVSLSGTTPQDYLNLARFEAVRVDVGLVGGSTGVSQILQAAYSADNGATWGSYQSLVLSALGGGGEADRRNFAGLTRINLVTGAYISIGVSAGFVLSAQPINASGTHTVPANCNAVRFRMSAGNGTGVLDLTALSGVQG